MFKTRHFRHPAGHPWREAIAPLLDFCLNAHSLTLDLDTRNELPLRLAMRNPVTSTNSMPR